MSWNNNISELSNGLKSLSVCMKDGNEIDPDSAFIKLKEQTIQVRESGKTVYLIGNGASASMASHAAADLAKNAHVYTEVFTDLSLITAVANDISYEHVFAEPLRWKMTDKDMLIAISSSGESPNVISASEVAISKGAYVVSLSAMKPDNRLRLQGNLNFYVPVRTYGYAETCHAAILHYWIDQIVSGG
ncbi:SIS domain-containing protein [Candidatus Magnetomoraceae bacterium gMMP-1]